MAGRVQGFRTARQGAGRSVGAKGWRTRAALLACGAAIMLDVCPPRAGVAAGLTDERREQLSFVARPGDGVDPQLGGGVSVTSGAVWSPLEPNSGDARESFAPQAPPFSSATTLPRRSVCVRLCDGYYFPIGPLSSDADLGDHEAACAGLCPDAPTRLFVEPGGSEGIEDAVAEDGARYVALPTAFRNRTVVDKSCACHRRGGQAFPLLKDFTLRKGDTVVTPSGVAVFRGSGHSPFVQEDFASLAEVAMPPDRRAALAAIERAVVPDAGRSSAPAAPRASGIAFAAPVSGRPTLAPSDDAIRFVEAPVRASN